MSSTAGAPGSPRASTQRRTSSPTSISTAGPLTGCNVQPLLDRTPQVVVKCNRRSLHSSRTACVQPRDRPGDERARSWRPRSSPPCAAAAVRPRRARHGRGRATGVPDHAVPPPRGPPPLPPAAPAGPAPPPTTTTTLRGRTADPGWARWCLLALLAGTALLYLWHLGASGWANAF